MASIIWILSAGAYTLHVQRNRELERIGWFCHLTTSGSGPDYKKCLDDEKAYYPKLVPREGEQAAIVAFVPVVLSWGFVCLLLALVRLITRTVTTHPSRRKWLGSNWKRIGIAASIVWIVGMGTCIFRAERHYDTLISATLKQYCISEKRGLDYNECLKQVDSFVAKQLPKHIIRAIVRSAFIPILGWVFAYVILALVRQNERLLMETGAPQVRTIQGDESLDE